MPADAPPRCGDHVLHRPSGQKWVIAWAEGEYLAPSGWPGGIARLADCDVIERCSDDMHRTHIEMWRRSQGDDGRRSRVLRLYGQATDGKQS